MMPRMRKMTSRVKAPERHNKKQQRSCACKALPQWVNWNYLFERGLGNVIILVYNDIHWVTLPVAAPWCHPRANGNESLSQWRPSRLWLWGSLWDRDGAGRSQKTVVLLRFECASGSGWPPVYMNLSCPLSRWDLLTPTSRCWNSWAQHRDNENSGKHTRYVEIVLT